MEERTKGGHWCNLAFADIQIQKVEKCTIKLFESFQNVPMDDQRIEPTKSTTRSKKYESKWTKGLRTIVQLALTRLKMKKK